MTRDQMATVATTAKDEIREMAERHPEIALHLSGAGAVLAAGLAVAKGIRTDSLAEASLRGSLRIAGDAIAGALARRPEIARADARVLDVAQALQQLAA